MIPSGELIDAGRKSILRNRRRMSHTDVQCHRRHPISYRDLPARANFVRTLYDPLLLSAHLVPLDASHESTARVSGTPSLQVTSVTAMVAETQMRLHREPGPVHAGNMFAKLHTNNPQEQEQRPRLAVWVSSADLQYTRVFHMAIRYPLKTSLSLRPGTNAWKPWSRPPVHVKPIPSIWPVLAVTARN
jgi:hypothetical protein